MAIETQCAVRTIGTEIEVFTRITTTRVIAVGAELHIRATHEIDGILTIDRPIRVIDVLRSHRG